MVVMVLVLVVKSVVRGVVPSEWPSVAGGEGDLGYVLNGGLETV